MTDDLQIVVLSALMHDVGKFAQRAMRFVVPETFWTHLCPRYYTNRFSIRQKSA